MKYQPIDPSSAILKIKSICNQPLGLYSINPHMDASLKLSLIDRVLKGVDAYIKETQSQEKKK
jgi:hypothetical protein